MKAVRYMVSLAVLTGMFLVAGCASDSAGGSRGAGQQAGASGKAAPLQPELIRVGETLTFTGIGFGAVNPGVEAGETTAEENSLLLPITVRIGDAEAQVQYAGLAPGQIGVYLFKVVVPEIAEAGILPLTITVDGAEISQKLSVAVEKAAVQE